MVLLSSTSSFVTDSISSCLLVGLAGAKAYDPSCHGQGGAQLVCPGVSIVGRAAI